MGCASAGDDDVIGLRLRMWGFESATGVQMSDDDWDKEASPYELTVRLRKLGYAVEHLQSFVTDLTSRVAELENQLLPHKKISDPFNSLGLMWTPFDGVAAPLLSSFMLQTDLGRRSFLATLYWAYQKGGIIAATNHVWANLAEPKTTRANNIGRAAGVSGRAKTAIRHTLEQFLDETRTLKVGDLPDRKEFEDFDDWNNACIQHFQYLEKSLNVYLVRYSVALNGGEA